MDEFPIARITQYDSISGEELSPYRRLSAGCIKTFIGGYALAAIFEPGGFVSICFGVAKGPSATSNTFWCRCISLISPIPCNDPYDDSHYVRHSILYPNSTSALGWQISHIVL